MSYCVRRHMKSLLLPRNSGQILQEVFRRRRRDESTLNQAPSVTLSTYARETGDLTHTPVMTKEVLEHLNPVSGHTVVDMTFGAGGHSRVILQKAQGVKLVAVDRDPLAFDLASKLAYEPQVKSVVIPVLGRFSELHHHLDIHDIEEGSVDSFLFDLGVSSMQFDCSQRGFCLSQDGPLDMRMDGDRYPDHPTAAELLNELDVGDLSLVLKGYGEERRARSIAQAIVEARYAFGNISRTHQLAQIVDTVFEGNHKKDKLMRHAHPATRVFQALRIFVNNELNELHAGLALAWRYLRPGGTCAVISFHSLEDRIVKRHFHGIEMDAQGNMTVRDHHRNSQLVQPTSTMEKLLQKRWRPVSKKVATPTLDELVANPRSRSAKLRAATKL